ncbi:MAG: gliding motility-associated C-terminal domain-containing protein [Flavobacteriales bacterium]|nr:gliding motility-associated C-terminal domain-containing protein [Flavobacteriales bacterium]
MKYNRTTERCIYIIFFVFVQLIGRGQTEIEVNPQVFSIAGIDYQNSEYLFSITIGQPVFQTISNSDVSLTQGYQQPADVVEPDTTLVLTITLNECSQLYTIRIVSAAACGSQEITFLWNGEVGDSTFVGTGPIVQFMIESESGCLWQTHIDLDIQEVELIPCLLTFYGLITPNSDGSNDSWIIENIQNPDFSENEVIIVNRWGSEVWSGSNYDNDNVVWTGISKAGQTLPDGTYFYSVETQSHTFLGYVELQR